MVKTLEYFFDVVSPTAYLASSQLPAILQRTGAELKLRPFFLGGVMQATGNRPPAMVPAKGKHMMRDLERFADRYGVTMAFNPHFPMKTLSIQRSLTEWAGSAKGDQLLEAAFRACWVDQVDVSDDAKLSSALSAAGVDTDAFWAAANREANKGALKATTAEAVERGAFGAPTFFVGEDMFFGQDRLDFVEEALSD